MSTRPSNRSRARSGAVLALLIASLTPLSLVAASPNVVVCLPTVWCELGMCDPTGPSCDDTPSDIRAGVVHYERHPDGSGQGDVSGRSENEYLDPRTDIVYYNGPEGLQPVGVSTPEAGFAYVTITNHLGICVSSGTDVCSSSGYCATHLPEIRQICAEINVQLTGCHDVNLVVLAYQLGDQSSYDWQPHDYTIATCSLHCGDLPLTSEFPPVVMIGPLEEKITECVDRVSSNVNGDTLILPTAALTKVSMHSYIRPWQAVWCGDPIQATLVIDEHSAPDRQSHPTPFIPYCV